MAWVTDARVLQMTQETSFAHGTFTVKGSHSIMAGGSIETDGSSAVIDVLAAALSRPAIDTNARVPTLGVEAGASIVAGIGLELTLIHIFRTELTCPFWRTLAVIGVHAIHTCTTIHASVIRAIVNIYLAVWSFETW